MNILLLWHSTLKAKVESSREISYREQMLQLIANVTRMFLFGSLSPQQTEK